MAKILHKDVGDLWSEPTATFKIGSTSTDPTNLTVRLQDSAGTESVLLNNVLVSTLNASSTPVAKTATGVFQLNPGVSLTSSGYWMVRFEGTGAVTAAEEHEVIVDPSEFTSNAGLSNRALVGLRETKDWLQQQQIDTGEDLELVEVINAVSDRFHEEAEREFRVDASTASATRTFFADDLAIKCGIIEVGDLAALGTTPAVRILADDWTTVIATVSNSSLILHPEVRPSWAPARRMILNKSVLKPNAGYRIEVTGTWGFPAVPPTVKQAVKDSIAAIMDRDTEHWRQDVAPQQAGEGTNVIVFGGRPLVISLPPAALAVAQRFQDGLVG